MASKICQNNPGPGKQPVNRSLMGQPEADDIRLRYRLATSTYENLCCIQQQPERRDVFQAACLATEFQTFPIKTAERTFLCTINDHTGIPYHLTEPISEPWHKVFLLVQIDLSRQQWPAKLSQTARKELYSERGRIYIALDKVLRCVVDILGSRGDGRGVSVALDVLRSVHAQIWEGNGMELLQVEGIGPAKLKRLADAGVYTIRKLSSMEFYHIERLLSRNPPFGQTVLRQVAGFPLLRFSLDVVGKHQALERKGTISLGGDGDLWIARVTMGYDNADVPVWGKKSLWVTLVVEAGDGRLLWFWRGAMKKLADGKELVVALDAKTGEGVKATLACETVVGTLIQAEFKI